MPSIRRYFAVLLLLATGVAQTQAFACPMDTAHHTANAEPAVEASHSAHAASDVHGVSGPSSRVHDIPADPLESGQPCILFMACAPAALATPSQPSLAAHRPQPLSTDWPVIVHSSADLLPKAPPPRLIA